MHQQMHAIMMSVQYTTLSTVCLVAVSLRTSAGVAFKALKATLAAQPPGSVTVALAR
jgi:hypothetical protein